MDKLQKVQEALERFIPWAKDAYEGNQHDYSIEDFREFQELEQALAELKQFRESETTEEKLWQLLDDIDTASDMFKPEQTEFYKYVMAKAEEHHKYLVSDDEDN